MMTFNTSRFIDRNLYSGLFASRLLFLFTIFDGLILFVSACGHKLQLD